MSLYCHFEPGDRILIDDVLHIVFIGPTGKKCCAPIIKGVISGIEYVTVESIHRESSVPDRAVKVGE